MTGNRKVATILTLALSACQPVSSRDGADPADPGSPNPTEPRPQPPAEITAEGNYQVISTFDLTTDALLPGQAYAARQVLVDFRDNPAATLFALLDDAGVPLVDELLAVLPGSLESRLEGWINQFVFESLLDDQPVTEALDQIIALARTVLTRFDVESELVLPAFDGDDSAIAAHVVRALRVPVGAQGVAVAVPDLAGATRDSLDVWIEREGAGLHVVFGEHSFGLPYGEYAYAALERALAERYGADLRGTLGRLVDCPALAASVAERCVLTLCVGHRDELEAICEQGLDRAADELESRFHELRFDALALASGEAELVDSAAGDGRADELRGGAWQGAIDLGQGPRDIAAVFAGARVQ